MIWIDLESHLPTDTTIPGWTPWTAAQWQAWLAESARLVTELERLHVAGDIKARNDYIDANSDHWGKLKLWLLALSAGKCWFSEARDIYSHLDVEHFRPKKEAKRNDNIDDGYWWLAFDYMNFRACGNVGNRKKGGWFPLNAGSLCSSYGNRCEESEVHYLLDPMDSDDVNLLAFDEEGNAIAAPAASAWEESRVDETIKRLKLNEHAALTAVVVKGVVAFPMQLFFELSSRSKLIFVDSRRRPLVESSFGTDLTTARAWRPLPGHKALFFGRGLPCLRHDGAVLG